MARVFVTHFHQPSVEVELVPERGDSNEARAPNRHERSYRLVEEVGVHIRRLL